MLHVENLSLFYQSVRGIEDISFSLQAGLYTVIGPSGCGKTSLFRCLAGLETPSAGTIDHQTRRLNQHGRMLIAPPDRGIMLVSQESALWPHLSSLDNVASVLRGRGMNRRGAREQAMELLSELRVEHLATRRPFELSGGQARCVEIARALAVETDTLLLDEPFSGIDIQAGAEILERLLTIEASRKQLILLSTHSPYLLEKIGRPTLLLDSGHLIAHGPLDTLQRQVNSTFLDVMQHPGTVSPPPKHEPSER